MDNATRLPAGITPAATGWAAPRGAAAANPAANLLPVSATPDPRLRGDDPVPAPRNGQPPRDTFSQMLRRSRDQRPEEPARTAAERRDPVPPPRDREAVRERPPARGENRTTAREPVREAAREPARELTRETLIDREPRSAEGERPALDRSTGRPGARRPAGATRPGAARPTDTARTAPGTPADAAGLGGSDAVPGDPTRAGAPGDRPERAATASAQDLAAGLGGWPPGIAAPASPAVPGLPDAPGTAAATAATPEALAATGRPDGALPTTGPLDAARSAIAGRGAAPADLPAGAPATDPASPGANALALSAEPTGAGTPGDSRLRAAASAERGFEAALARAGGRADRGSSAPALPEPAALFAAGAFGVPDAGTPSGRPAAAEGAAFTLPSANGPTAVASGPLITSVSDTAASSTASGSIDAPVDSPAFAPALAAQVTVMARDGVQRAELRLNPAELGPVSVQIVVDGAQARVDFVAESAQTRQSIENGLPTLASALRDAGLTLAGGGVFQQPRDPRGGGQAEPGEPGRGRSLRVEVGGVGPAGAAAAPTGRIDPRRALDVYA
jgi:flagellar hook-length control protein FliK